MLTTVVLIRHAKAAEGEYEDDRQRPLAPEGREQQRAGAQFLKDKKLIPDRIFCSPYLRAREAAEIIGELYGVTPVTEPALGSNFDREQLLSLLVPEKTYFLVGHEPTLMTFANRLVGHPCLPTGLSKGAALVLTFDEVVGFGSGLFAAYLPPQPVPL